MNNIDQGRLLYILTRIWVMRTPNAGQNHIFFAEMKDFFWELFRASESDLIFFEN